MARRKRKYKVVKDWLKQPEFLFCVAFARCVKGMVPMEEFDDYGIADAISDVPAAEFRCEALKKLPDSSYTLECRELDQIRRTIRSDWAVAPRDDLSAR